MNKHEAIEIIVKCLNELSKYEIKSYGFSSVRVPYCGIIISGLPTMIKYKFYGVFRKLEFKSYFRNQRQLEYYLKDIKVREGVRKMGWDILIFKRKCFWNRCMKKRRVFAFRNLSI